MKFHKMKLDKMKFDKMKVDRCLAGRNQYRGQYRLRRCCRHFNRRSQREKIQLVKMKILPIVESLGQDVFGFKTAGELQWSRAMLRFKKK